MKTLDNPINANQFIDEAMGLENKKDPSNFKLVHVMLSITFVLLICLLVDVWTLTKKIVEEKMRIDSIRVEQCIKNGGNPKVLWAEHDVICIK